MAQKKLSERIAERTQEQGNIGRKQQYQAIFLSLREEIEEAYRAGWKVKTIWETLHSEKKFDGTYECFLSYFNKTIKEDNSPRGQISPGRQRELLPEQSGQACPTHNGDEDTSAQHIRQRAVPKPFTHNPVASDLKNFA